MRRYATRNSWYRRLKTARGALTDRPINRRSNDGYSPPTGAAVVDRIHPTSFVARASRRAGGQLPENRPVVGRFTACTARILRFTCFSRRVGGSTYTFVEGRKKEGTDGQTRHTGVHPRVTTPSRLEIIAPLFPGGGDGGDDQVSKGLPRDIRIGQTRKLQIRCEIVRRASVPPTPWPFHRLKSVSRVLWSSNAFAEAYLILRHLLSLFETREQ